MKSFLLNDMKARSLVPGGEVKFVHSEHMTVSYWHFEADAEIPGHAHPHEQIVNLLEGTLEFTVNGEMDVFHAPAAIVIPSNMNHSGKTLTECTIIDVFYPMREDFAKLDG